MGLGYWQAEKSLIREKSVSQVRVTRVRVRIRVGGASLWRPCTWIFPVIKGLWQADRLNYHASISCCVMQRAVRKLSAVSSLERNSLLCKCDIMTGQNDDMHCGLSVMTVVDFFNRINVIYGVVCEFCSEQTCPTMSGGQKWVTVLDFRKLWDSLQNLSVGYSEAQASVPRAKNKMGDWVSEWLSMWFFSMG